MPINHFSPDLEQTLLLPKVESWPEAKHRFQKETVDAVQAALAAGRPLLLRGEPGIGKSQVARAVAAELGVPFLSFVVDERTERDDLLYSFDAVSRLAQAQLASIQYREASNSSQSKQDDEQPWQDRMAEACFIRPGVLWWAFNWTSAEKQTGKYFRACPSPVNVNAKKDTGTEPNEPCCSSVVLIDEIDKADPSVPNGLLESLGNNGFRVSHTGESVELPKGQKPPLVMITTNEERELPAAFLRRCFVLVMNFPPEGVDTDTFLRERARVSFSEEEISDEVCSEITKQLLKDRKAAADSGLAKPGAAEFLDLAKVLVALHPGDEKKQLDRLEKISRYALRKSTETL